MVLCILSSALKIFYKNFLTSFEQNYSCFQWYFKFFGMKPKMGYDIINSKVNGEVGYEQRVQLLWTVYRGAPWGGH